jgi:uncharacterized protein (DUF1330 family)
MAAYVIANVVVQDTEGYQEYTHGTPGSVAAFGGRFIVRGGATEVLEGDWEPSRLVVIEFEDLEHARRWYQSEDYQALKRIREATASSNLVLVEGV